MMISRISWSLMVVTLGVACGDSGSDGSGGSAQGGAASGTGGGSVSTGGAPGTGGAASSSGGGSVTAGGAPGTGGAGEGGTGGAPVTINGCTLATAEDLTGTDPTLSWDFGHQRCIIVSAGATVTWNGSQGLHPLVGGESPNVDPTSPIAGAMGNATTVAVTFDTAGTYPYFCAVHTSMRGVVYVQ